MFQILCLDGGGIRGIFSAAVLAAIEEDLNVRAIDHFDLIAGTSTGGIIAVALGLGLTPREIVDFYLTEGAAIFANPLGLASIRRTFRSKFTGMALRTALQKHLGEKRFGDSSKRLVIPSYNLAEDDVISFVRPITRAYDVIFEFPPGKLLKQQPQRLHTSRRAIASIICV